MSQAAAARLLGVSQEAVRLWVRDRKLIGHRVSGWKVPRLLTADVQSFKRRRDRGAR